MKTPSFAPSLKNLKFSSLAKKFATVNSFYSKHPNKGIEEIKNDGPEKKSVKPKQSA